MAKYESGAELAHLRNDLARSVFNGLSELTAFEARLLWLCLSQIDGFVKPEIIDGKITLPVARVPMSDIKERILDRGDAYKLARAAGKKLKSLECNYYNPDNPKEWIEATWGEGRISDGQFTFIFSAAISQALSSIQNDFVAIDIRCILNIGGQLYAQRLYPLLASYAFNGSVVISIKELRQRLKVSEETYARNADFIKRCIREPIAHITEVTKLAVAMEKANHGQTITSIKFTIIPRKNTPELGENGKAIKQAKKLEPWEEWWDVAYRQVDNYREMWGLLKDADAEGYKKHFLSAANFKAGAELPPIEVQHTLAHRTQLPKSVRDEYGAKMYQQHQQGVLALDDIPV